MKFLLDTHVFIWLVANSKRIKTDVYLTLLRSDVRLYLSTASVWEMQIKIGVNKLELGRPLQRYIAANRKIFAVRTLPVYERHVWSLADLPLHHRDPFDRMMIAQAVADGLILVSADMMFDSYEVDFLQARA